MVRIIKLLSAFVLLLVLGVVEAKQALASLTDVAAQTWVRRDPASVKSNLSAVVYGNNKYVAVGETGIILTSPDSNQWSQVPSPTADSLYGIAYGNNTYVAVGDPGTILVSHDGTNWIAAGSGTTRTLNGVAFCGSRFVAVGDGGTLLVSPDGTTWTPAASGTANDLYGVGYGNGMIIAVGASGTLLSSQDAITWTSVVTGSTEALYCIAYGNGVYVAMSNLGDVLTSADGHSWSVQHGGALLGYSSLAFGNGVFAGVANGQQPLISVDGVNGSYWGATPGYTSSALSFRGVTFGPAGFTAVGSSGQIINSSDGSTWTVLTPRANNTIYAAAYGNNRYVAVGGNATASILTSGDGGATWTPAGTPPVINLRGVGYGNGTFVVVGQSGSIYTSTDCLTWSSRSSGTTNYLYSVAYLNNAFIAVGANSTILTSPDGVAWKKATSVPSGLLLLGVAYANGRYVAVSQTGYGIITSADGNSWVYATINSVSLTSFVFKNLAYGNGVFATVETQSGQALTSPDGIVWTGTNGSFPSYTAINGVAYGGGQFVAVGTSGGSGAMFTSTDGVSWTKLNQGLARGVLWCLAYGNGSFVVAGYGGIIMQSTAPGTGTYTVTSATSTTGGSITSSSPSVGLGGIATYTITPATGYAIAAITDNGVPVTAVPGANGTYTYTVSNVSANHDVRVSFVQVISTVASSVIRGKGTISPAGTVAVNRGDTPTFTIAPANGYVVTDVLVDGAAVGAVSSYTFPPVTGNHVLQAVFDLDPTLATLTQTVVSGGAPVAGAQVEVVGNPAISATTDANGTSVLVVPKGLTFSYSISKTGFRTFYSENYMLTSSITVPDGSLFTDAQVTGWGGDPRFGMIRGRVVDLVTGQTINNPTIVAQSTVNPGTFYQAQYDPTCGTGGDTCYYNIIDVAANDAVIITASAPGYTPSQLQLPALPADGVGNGSLKLLTAPPPSSQTVISGTVADSAGKAVPGATVAAGSNATVTDASGYFKLNVTVGSSFTLKVTANGYKTTYSQRLSIASPQSTGITLYTPAEVTGFGGQPGMGAVIGTVFDQAAKQPIAGAALTSASQVDYFDGTNWGGSATAANGFFAVRNIQPSPSGTTVTISANMPGYASIENTSTCVFNDDSVCIGNIALNPLSVSVPTGTNVNVTPAANISLNFTSVQSNSGTTGTVSAQPVTLPSEPPNFQVLGGTAYDIHPDSNVVLSGTPITVCITYNPLTLAVPANIQYLRLLHFNSTTQKWEDITTSVDTNTNQVCGATTSFSPFVVGQPGTYTITASETTSGSQDPTAGGSITPAGDFAVALNGNVTYTITPATGYRIGSVSVDGGNVGAVTTYSFSNVQANHTIAVTFELNPAYTVTASAGPGGSISPAGTVSVTGGTSQYFFVTPSAGYDIADLVVDGVSKGALSAWGFLEVTAPHTISVSFAPINYTITASAGTGGSISPAGAVSAPGGSNQYFYITPASGYLVQNVVVDTVSQGAVSSYSFTNVAGPHTISASFVPTVTATSGSGGGISPSGTTAVPSGSQSYTMVPNTGYHVKDVLVNGTSVGAVTSYSFTGVTAPQTIAVTFELGPVYTVSASAGPGGSISPAGTVSVTGGTSQYFSITPSAGYSIANLVVDGVSKGALSAWGFLNVTAPHTISVSFAPSYTITASAGTGGSISPAGVVSAPGGSNQYFYITPATGYRVQNVVVDTVSRGAVSSYSFTNVAGPHTISASFVPTVTATSGSGGGISPSGTTAVPSGSQSYTMAPNSGYHVKDVLVNGTSVGAVTSYSFTGVTAPQTIAVTFELNAAYTISASAGPGGSISPAGTVSVTGGTSQYFSVTPSAGYSIANLVVDGVSKGAVSTWGFLNVTAPHTISVSFAPSYTITASAGTGGSISPAGVVSAPGGSNQYFYITPAAGYRVQNVVVDTVSQGAVSSYSFTNVAGPHTISASFVPTVTATSGSGGGISPSGTTAVPSGSQSYTMVPNTGYHVKDVLVNGTSVGAVTSYSFTGVTAPQTIAVTFELNAAYTISASAGPGGSISPAGTVSVTGGASQYFSITPSAGYSIANLVVDGVSKGAVSAWGFLDVTAPHTVSVSFAPI
jgi:hypothetical protein